MPTYALLGATGATGTAIIRALLANPPTQFNLRVLVRSRTKLLVRYPDLQTNPSFPVTIIEGTAEEQTAIQQCLKGADIIMACVATNTSLPNPSIVADTATTITSALKMLRSEEGSDHRTPTILQLRSRSLNEAVKTHPPGLAEAIVGFCLAYIYNDLQRASDHVISVAKQDPTLLKYIFIDPPALHDKDGTVPTGYQLATDGTGSGVVSYPDLGAAFCEVASRLEEFVGKAVCVSATGKVKLTWGNNIGFLLTGAKARIRG